jgi:hypothetical protein
MWAHHDRIGLLQSAKQFPDSLGAMRQVPRKQRLRGTTIPQSGKTPMF